jgi:hypothetical protein
MVESHRRYYKKEPYSPYRLMDRPRYPYQPQPPEGSRANLSRVIVTRQSSLWVAQVSRRAIGELPLELTPFPHVVTAWFAVHARQLEQQ